MVSVGSTRRRPRDVPVGQSNHRQVVENLRQYLGLRFRTLGSLLLPTKRVCVLLLGEGCPTPVPGVVDEADVEQAAELSNRLRMVVDSDVDRAVRVSTVTAAFTAHQEGG